jgi:hypothetical protein
MGVFNNIVVSERHQRPSFNGITILRADFVRDGQYVNLPIDQVSSINFFKKTANLSPSTVLDPSTGLITDAAASAAIWRWAPSAGDSYLTESDFSQTTDRSASGVFEIGTGRLAVFLNGANDVSSQLRDGTVIGSLKQLSGEPATDYIDVWTVKTVAGGEWQTFINETQFFQGNSVLITQPLLVNPRNSLWNKNVYLGEKVKLKVGTEVTIENKDIDNATKNVLRAGLITSGSMEIKKHNEDANLPAWVTVSGYTDTSNLVDVTSDNTFVFDFDTAVLTNGSISDLGNGTGAYSVRVKYNILDETYISPMMYFTVV